MTVGGAQQNRNRSGNRTNSGKSGSGRSNSGRPNGGRSTGGGTNVSSRNSGQQRQRQRSATSAARAVSAARGGNRNVTRFVIGVVVLLVIALVVVGGVLYQHHKTTEAAQTVIPALTVQGSTSYPTTIDKVNATVLVGKPDAKITVDAYEDFLCPICGDFESTYFKSIEQQLQAGTVKVRYHMINLLDSNSNPAGYSSMAANTALAVATVAPSKFIDFHYSLYNKQPQEDGPGWTQAQLDSLANRLGVSGTAFQKLVDDKTYDNQIQTNMNNANNNQALWQTDSSGTKGFGTPTIVVDNKVIDWQNDATWLSDLVNTNYPNGN